MPLICPDILIYMYRRKDRLEDRKRKIKKKNGGLTDVKIKEVSGCDTSETKKWYRDWRTKELI